METVGLLDPAAVKAGDAGIIARRKWTDPAGRPLDGNAVKVGDLVRVEVTLALAGGDEGAAVGNVAIVDALPGGLEPENPRLETSAARSGAAFGGADRAEFLSDRVVLFAEAAEEAKTFVYYLRAVTTGTFTCRPSRRRACTSRRSRRSRAAARSRPVRGRIRQIALRWTRRLTVAALATAAALLALVAAFPFPRALLAPPPLSPAVIDREGRPLLLLAAADGRWRLRSASIGSPRGSPSPRSPWRTRASGSHLGVTPAAAPPGGRAERRERRAWCPAPARHDAALPDALAASTEPPSKVVEAFRAFELELSLAKDDILERYLSRAPYGGGVEGAEAASLVWFSRPAADLSLPRPRSSPGCRNRRRGCARTSTPKGEGAPRLRPSAWRRRG